MESNRNGNNMEMYAISPPKTPPSPEKHQAKFWSIDKKMLRFKVHYFFFTAAVGIFLPYLTIFAQEEVGISASALSAILTAKICIFIFSKPVIGYLADYFSKLKVIICILSVIATVAFFLLLTVPKIEKDAEQATLKHVNSCETLFTGTVNNLSEIHQNDRYQLEDTLFLSNSDSNIDWCLPSLTNFLKFLKECPGSYDRSFENASSILENVTDLKQKYIFSEDNISSQPDSFLCEACCKLSGQCTKIQCQIPKNSSKIDPIENKPMNDFQTYQFWLYAVFATISMTSWNSFYTLTDIACCESVQNSGAQFGRQRLWGAIGWGLLSPVSGFVIDLTGGFLASLIMMAICSFISLLNIIGLRIEKPQFSKNLLKDIGTVLASKEFLAFKFCVIMNGIGAGFIYFYLVLFLTNIGGNRFLCGLVNFVQCFIGEIPFMFFSDWAITKLGHFNLQTFSLMAYCIRFFWYSQLYNPWVVLPVEVLHGFTFGLFYPCVTSFAKLSSKPGTEATTQAVLFAAFEGVGVGIGCVVAGVGFDTIGSHTTCLCLSIFTCFAMILSIVLNVWIRQQKRSINVTSSTYT